jgi:hypothetical protein
MKVTLVRALVLISVVMLMSAGTPACAQAPVNEATIITKDKVVGKWKNDDLEYTFNNDGTSLVTIDKRECPGTWELRDKILLINPKKLMYKKDDPCSKSQWLHVLSMSSTDMHVFKKVTKKEFHLTKQNGKETE